MAVLTATELGLRLPIGNRYQKSFTVAVASNDATDEWIATGFVSIDAVVGYAVHGATAQTETPNFVLNAQGTSATAGANPGDLAIEIPDVTNATLHVTVLGA